MRSIFDHIWLYETTSTFPHNFDLKEHQAQPLTASSFDQATMGQVLGSQDEEDHQGAANQGGVDQYGRPMAFYRPGPPTTIDLTKLVECGNPEWWCQKCSTSGCRSWIWLTKTRHPSYQTCSECEKPWVVSFQEIGPHYTDGIPS